MTKTERRPLGDYLAAHYTVVLTPSEDGGYVAKVAELEGCVTQGETLEEALDMLDDAREAWIRDAYEDGAPIPLPIDRQDYSGKFVVRTPKSLHRDLVTMAEREGVSLNQLVVSLLSRAVSRQ